MEPIGSSETSAYINTLTPGTYPKEKKLHKYCSQSENFAFYQPAVTMTSFVCVKWVKQDRMEKIILEIGPAVGNQIMFPTPLIITTEW